MTLTSAAEYPCVLVNHIICHHFPIKLHNHDCIEGLESITNAVDRMSRLINLLCMADTVLVV